MITRSKTQRTCPQGHIYYKSSDCPVCPICESEKKAEGFLNELAAPARRALEGQGITTVQKLSGYTEKEVLALHGIGKSAMPKLKAALAAQELSFKG